MLDQLVLEGPAQHRALFEETRLDIVNLLRERAATVTELAATLGKPKGTVAHHMKTLEDAGLVRVVRTEQDRAITAKYYGRTAQLFIFDNSPEIMTESARILGDAQSYFAQATHTPVPDGDFAPAVNVRYVRVPAEAVQEYFHRIQELLHELSQLPPSGEVTLVVAAYPRHREPLDHP